MFHRRPFYARRRSLACVIGVHLPMPGALGVLIMLQVTGHAGGVPKATLERGRSVEFPSEGNSSFFVFSFFFKKRKTRIRYLSKGRKMNKQIE